MVLCCGYNFAHERPKGNESRIRNVIDLTTTKRRKKNNNSIHPLLLLLLLSLDNVILFIFDVPRVLIFFFALHFIFFIARLFIRCLYFSPRTTNSNWKYSSSKRLIGKKKRKEKQATLANQYRCLQWIFISICFCRYYCHFERWTLCTARWTHNTRFGGNQFFTLFSSVEHLKIELQITGFKKMLTR